MMLQTFLHEACRHFSFGDHRGNADESERCLDEVVHGGSGAWCICIMQVGRVPDSFPEVAKSKSKGNATEKLDSGLDVSSLFFLNGQNFGAIKGDCLAKYTA